MNQEQTNQTTAIDQNTSSETSPKSKMSWWNLLLIIVIPADLIATQTWLGAAPCLGGRLDKCSALNPKILIFAALVTIIYGVIYFKKNPRKFTLSGNPFIRWEYAIFLWWSLVFFGETLPQLSGIARGITPSTYGYHFGMMDNPLQWVATGQIWDLISFAGLGILGAVLFRYLYWPIATVLSAVIGAIIEYLHFNPSEGYFDTYSPKVDLVGTIAFLASIWTVLFLLSFIIYSHFGRLWNNRGKIVAIIIILVLNFGSAAFFAYERSVNPAARQGSPGESVKQEKQTLGEGQCPDQILLNNGPIIAYSNGKEFQLSGQQEMDKILSSCPNVQKIYQKPNGTK